MKSNKFFCIWIKLLIFPCLAMLLMSCNKDDDETNTQQPIDNPQHVNGETIVVGEYEWHNGKRIKLLDITDYYNSISYVYPLTGKAVNHIAFENLPQGLKETIRKWGVAFPTRVFRTKWKGETVYHLLSMIQNEDYGVYHESGENYNLYQNPGQYVAFIEEQEGTANTIKLEKLRRMPSTSWLISIPCSIISLFWKTNVTTLVSGPKV